MATADLHTEELPKDRFALELEFGMVLMLFSHSWLVNRSLTKLFRSSKFGITCIPALCCHNYDEWGPIITVRFKIQGFPSLSTRDVDTSGLCSFHNISIITALSRAFDQQWFLLSGTGPGSFPKFRASATILFMATKVLWAIWNWTGCKSGGYGNWTTSRCVGRVTCARGQYLSS